MFPEEKISYLDFDIYSRRLSFFYKNKEKLGSTFGFFLTVLYAITSIILFLIYFIKTINREDITASDTIISPNKIPSANISKESFYLAFGLEHPTKLIRFIDETIYYPEVLFIEKIRENGQLVKKSQKMINLERCEIIKFGENYQHLFNEDVNNSYCLKDLNFTLIGGINYNIMSYIQINIFPCINKTENNNHCKPQKEIDEYLTSGYFSILAKDRGLNPFNYSFPTKPVLRELLTSIDKSLKKQFIIYYGITEIDSDTGLFIKNIKKEIHLRYVKTENNVFFIDENYRSGREIISAEIRIEDNIYYQKRTFTKMSQVFSTIGGYMQIISTIFSLIVLMSKKISIEKKLLNSLFNFNLKQKKIILCIEYQKKLDYNSSMDKEKAKKYIPYEAKKSIITNRKSKKRRNSIFINNRITPEMKRCFTESISIGKKEKKNNTEEGFKEIFNNINKENDPNQNINQSINRSKVNMINKEDNLNLNNLHLNKIYHKKKMLCSQSNLNILRDYYVFEKGNSPIISFSIFDYYCFRKITKKRTEIELFNFGINFYKRQMDIINFFNIIILTQIMLIQNSEQKHLSQTIELSIK